MSVGRKNRHGLTPQQEKFAQEVASGKNQSEAYRVAYPSSRRWKPATVHQAASRMMADSKVSARFASLQEAAAQVSVLKVAEILNETRRLALSTVSLFFHPNGKLKKPHELDSDAAATVAAFEILPDGTVKYRLWDKNASIERAAKIMGLFKEDNAQQRPETKVVIVPPKRMPESDDV